MIIIRLDGICANRSLSDLSPDDDHDGDIDGDGDRDFDHVQMRRAVFSSNSPLLDGPDL